MTETHETDHRFLRLGVDEVSLVDHPANEEEWLVIKRLGGKQMAKEIDGNVEAIQPPEEKVTEQEVTKADDTQPEAAVNDEAVAELVAVEDVEKALNPVQAMALLKKIHDMLMKVMGDDKYPEPKKSESTRKSLLGFSDDGELIINAELLADVQKAKAFTGKRINALSDAIKAMIEVLNEVDPDRVKKLTENPAASGLETAKKSIEESTEPVKEGPDFGEQITEAVEKALNPLDERLKSLETARGEPKSNDGDQTADIKKRNENFWAGVL